MSAPLVATRANMQRLADAGMTVVVLDTVTFDQFSATPGDYFMLPDDDPILDADGGPCVLARIVPARLEPITEDEIR